MVTYKLLSVGLIHGTLISSSSCNGIIRGCFFCVYIKCKQKGMEYETGWDCWRT